MRYDELTYNMKDERENRPEEGGEHLSDGLGALLDELNGNGNSLSKGNQDEDHNAENDSKNYCKGEPCFSQSK